MPMRILQRAGVLLFGVVTMYLILKALGLSGRVDRNMDHVNQDTVYFVAVEEVYGILYVPVDEYLIRCMADYWEKLVTADGRYAAVIPTLQDETLEALAVVIRTQLVCVMDQTGRDRFSGRKFFFADARRIQENWGYEGDITSEQILAELVSSPEGDLWKRMRKAIESTHGKVLLYNQDPADVTYHMMSNGQTRENANVFPWANTADCPDDKEQELSVTRVFYPLEELERLGIPAGSEGKPEVIQDAWGYVDRVIWGDMVFSGEGLAERLKLPSSAYLIMPDEEGCTLIAYGLGHGYGMSIMQADRMAQNEADTNQLLSFFYALLDCKKIE